MPVDRPARVGARMLTTGGECSGGSGTLTVTLLVALAPSGSVAVTVSVRAPFEAKVTSGKQPFCGKGIGRVEPPIVRANVAGANNVRARIVYPAVMVGDTRDERRRPRAFGPSFGRAGWLCTLAALAGCDGREAAEGVALRSFALTQTLAPASDTFINSHNPNNNNGASPSIFTGVDGQSGVMRGLVRFDLPAGLAGRVTVTGVQLRMTTRGLGPADGNPGTMATESLQAVSEAWAAGNGAGIAQTTFVVGQLCDGTGTTTGATWNQPNCGTAAANWATAGATVAAAISGQAVAPAAIDVAVIWDATSAGNAGMISDVQGWVDTPSSNHGWRITSSTETGAGGVAQRFYSVEAPANGPGLTFVYGCKPDFVASGNDCVARANADGGDAGDSRLSDGGGDGPGGDRIDGAAGTDGKQDAGPTAPGSSGCSCSVSGPAHSSIAIPVCAGALASLWGRRGARRRRPTRTPSP